MTISHSVADRLFFGRKDTLALFSKRIASFRNGFRQNIGILGAGFVGKSSLARQFDLLASRQGILVVPFACQESDSFERFAQRWMSEILFSLYQQKKSSVPQDFQILFQGLRGVIPKTLRRMKVVKKLTLQGRYANAYRELLGLGGMLSKEVGRQALFIIEDFDRLGDLPVKDPFAFLGQEMMTQKEVMYVVTSSRLSVSRSIFAEKLSLLFGNFEMVQVKPFDHEEANDFISEMLPDPHVLILQPDHRQFLIQLTDGHPYYLTVLLSRLRSRLRDVDADEERALARTISDELYLPHGLLHQHLLVKVLRAAQGRTWNVTADVLLAISLGNKKITQMVRFLHQRHNEVRRVLEKLVSSELVERHGSLYVIRDPLLRFWLSKVYYRTRFMSARAPQAGQDDFIKEVRAAIQSSVARNKKELPRRIEELFRAFRNDVLNYDQRKFRCPGFTEVVSRANNGRMFPVFAKNSKARWLCQILTNRVIEEDVHVFRQDLKRLRTPVQKKLLIGLKGIDLNAKLLAQEAKIQYLDLRQLNFLMDVFDQPKFVF